MLFVFVSVFVNLCLCLRFATPPLSLPFSPTIQITYINQFSRGHMGTTWTGTVNVKSWEAHETQENKQATGEEDEITELNDTLQWKLEDGVLTTPHGSYKKPENSSL
eukprot:TRINITY_DN3728_c0_g1_i2.p1 TRINITY_DN3728_c0_g1~~TRINITY_DN3728_c0_g1_i2.p1  ORF type:complete len:107 (-),score=37.17 TRINITY_DN3728_c0_g1_i2:70-390(-)